MYWLDGYIHLLLHCMYCWYGCRTYYGLDGVVGMDKIRLPIWGLNLTLGASLLPKRWSFRIIKQVWLVNAHTSRHDLHVACHDAQCPSHYAWPFRNLPAPLLVSTPCCPTPRPADIPRLHWLLRLLECRWHAQPHIRHIGSLL